jgi:two-component system CheB/CheR fusion protein
MAKQQKGRGRRRVAVAVPQTKAGKPPRAGTGAAARAGRPAANGKPKAARKPAGAARTAARGGKRNSKGAVRPAAPPQDLLAAAAEREPALPAFPIVGVGASAGGFEAFTQLLSELPADTPVAFVLVQHLAPDQDSSLAELLGRATALPVVRVADRMPVEPGKVYVIPPGVQMAIDDGGRLRLVPRAAVPGHFMPADAFFRSLAAYARTRAMAVVLSGADHDGSAGLREVEAAGGITFAQDPRSARSDGMPRAAIASGLVDFVLPPQRIASEILRLAQHPLLRSERVRARRRGAAAAVASAAGDPAGEAGRRRGARAARGGGVGGGPDADADGSVAISDDQFRQIFALLRSSTGVDFTHYKLPTIRRRLQRRMVLHRVPDVDQYIRFLQHNPGEVHGLYGDILINVTRFFREPESFEVLAARALPSILADRRDDQPIRVWVPGCATGEEPYSVAMLLLEHLAERLGGGGGGGLPLDVPVQIFATDVSATAIEQARAGIYGEAITADVSPERLRRFFTKVDGSWRVNKAVRDCCIFARQDLTRDPPFSRLDLIVCRNVLIYLGPVLQNRLMQVFHYALRPGRFLLLGSAETVGSHADLFSVRDKRHRLYVRRGGAGEAGAASPAGGGRETEGEPGDVGGGAVGVGGAAGGAWGSEAGRAGAAGPGGPGRFESRGAAPGNVQSEANRLLLARYAPAGVLVDNDLQIVQFRGQTGSYLEPAPGDASLHLLKMARDGLLFGLRTALHEARRGDVPVRKEGLRVRRNGHVVEVSLEVLPLAAPGQGRHFLVLFQDTSAPVPLAGSVEGAPSSSSSSSSDRGGGGRRGAKGPAAAARGEDARRVHRLEQELAANREYLQSIIQDLEAANEELQSANEEILSSNEELQSTNEELDTAKEELQSTNEELNTLNEELHGRNDELSRVNSDLVNLLGSVNIAIVMVSGDLRVRRFTPMAEQLLSLIPSDVGRPIGDIKPNVDVPDLEGMIAESIDRVTVLERSVTDRTGRAFSLRVRPYKDLANRIDGAVVALIDVSENARRADDRALADAASARRVTLESVERVLSSVRSPLLLLDPALRVVAANESFGRRFGCRPAELRDRPLAALGGAWAGPELGGVLARVTADGAAEGDIETGGVGGGAAGGGPVRLRARRLDAADGAPLMIVLAAEDDA